MGEEDQEATFSKSSSLSSLTSRELTSNDLVNSTEGRKYLKYLIGCALPKNVELYANVEGERHNFKGDMGFAPGWIDNGLSPSEQRWVSACIYARTNYFGKPVRISMRGDSDFPSLKSSDNEKKEFSIFEGGFFGNLFIEKPVAYVCTGLHSKIENKDAIFNWRVCAKSQSQNSKISQCQFIITGKCDDPKSFVIDKETYQEVIYVYLKPGLDSVCGKDCE